MINKSDVHADRNVDTTPMPLDEIPFSIASLGRVESFTMRGTVEAVLITDVLGTVVSEIYGHGSVATTETQRIQVIKGHGVKGDRHACVRLADVREREYLSFGLLKGGEIANFREISITSREELAEIAGALSLGGAILAGSLGENMIISGVPRLSQLPTGTMLFFSKGRDKSAQKRTAVIVIWKENTPCAAPGEVIEHIFPDSHASRLFAKAAIGKRGVVGSVYSSGLIHKGDTVTVYVPTQRLYMPFV